ncbi:hypothetical protein SKAU_G00013910 [Synaphobranchus kaupii]|uniref:Uncharacterized protein n=1 Tax=Synaphobranchus kaupii TaxID=118154 RepID=A0A9Q1GBQ1_SYNKA|nr:hypothetical protein SKAU_G00013910 [Synaphobranchus kaupii]
MIQQLRKKALNLLRVRSWSLSQHTLGERQDYILDRLFCWKFHSIQSLKKNIYRKHLMKNSDRTTFTGAVAEPGKPEPRKVDTERMWNRLETGELAESSTRINARPWDTVAQKLIRSPAATCRNSERRYFGCAALSVPVRPLARNELPD